MDGTNLREWDFRIDGESDYAALPTPTKQGTIAKPDGGTFQIYAAVGSTVASDDLAILGELQSDGAWHKIGVTT